MLPIPAITHIVRCRPMVIYNIRNRKRTPPLDYDCYTHEQTSTALLTSALSALCAARTLCLRAHIQVLLSSVIVERDSNRMASDGCSSTSECRFDDSACETKNLYLTAPDINSAAGTISRPIASRAFSNLNAASIHAIASQIEDSANWRPGQSLTI